MKTFRASNKKKKMSEHKQSPGKGNRTNHVNAGRKKKDDPRNNNVNIRLNDSEKEKFNTACQRSGMSQSNFIMSFVNQII